MRKAGLAGAWWTQVTAQVLAAWALVMLMVGTGAPLLYLIFDVMFTLVAVALPLKNDGTIRDRAIASMSAGAVLASVLSLHMLGILLSGFRMNAHQVLTLVAMVLFVVSGALYWLRREEN